MADPKTNAAGATETANVEPPAPNPAPLPDDSKPLVVQFLKPWGIYNAGEIAGFNASRAQWLLAHKLATQA